MTRFTYLFWKTIGLSLFIVGFCALIITAFLSCSHIPKEIAPGTVQVLELNLSKGLTFGGYPWQIAIPAGHPDFTEWQVIQYNWLTPEVVLVYSAKSGMGSYGLLCCETVPLVLGLHHSDKDEDLYWIYQDTVPVPVTKEEFEKRKTEAQYLCPGVEGPIEGKEI